MSGIDEGMMPDHVQPQSADSGTHEDDGERPDEQAGIDDAGDRASEPKPVGADRAKRPGRRLGGN